MNKFMAGLFLGVIIAQIGLYYHGKDNGCEITDRFHTCVSKIEGTFEDDV